MAINVCSWYLPIHSCVLGEEAVFEHEEKEPKTVFLQFLKFSSQMEANVNLINISANILSHLFSANNDKCKPGFIVFCKNPS